MAIKGKLLPGEALIYERANGVVFAHYRDPPHNKSPRWIVGGTSEGVSRMKGDLFSYGEWQHMMELAKTNKSFKIQLDRILVIYYTIKDTIKENK